MSEVIVFGLIDRSVAEVWRALTVPKAMRGWLCDAAEVDLRVGGGYRFSGVTVPDGSGGGEVTAVEPEGSLGFAWTMDGQKTQVRYELEDQAGMTRLTVSNLSLGELDRYFIFEMWRYYIACLKCMLETGRRPLRFNFRTRVTDTVEINIDLPVEASKAFAALTEAKRLDKWLTTGAQVDLRLGGAIDYGWGVDPVEITALEQDRLLTTAWPDGTEVTFRIETAGADATITVVQSGFGDPATANRTRSGWSVLLMGLAVHILTGANVNDWLGAESAPGC
jgi:uncharacterized protein YndB with AHSA1/START domain